MRPHHLNSRFPALTPSFRQGESQVERAGVGVLPERARGVSEHRSPRAARTRNRRRPRAVIREPGGSVHHEHPGQPLLDAVTGAFPSRHQSFGLIVFRIIWGFVGSQFARFSSFAFSPGKVIDYLRSLGKQPQHFIGHNPAGSYAI